MYFNIPQSLENVKLNIKLYYNSDWYSFFEDFSLKHENWFYKNSITLLEQK